MKTLPRNTILTGDSCATTATIQSAFTAYVTGAYTLDSMQGPLKRRGLRTRPTRTGQSYSAFEPSSVTTLPTLDCSGFE